jgi:hypothetical protein
VNGRNLPCATKEGTSPARLSGIILDLAALCPGTDSDNVIAEAYDPWQDRWHAVTRSGAKTSLPDFERSFVVRVRHR